MKNGTTTTAMMYKYLRGYPFFIGKFSLQVSNLFCITVMRILGESVKNSEGFVCLFFPSFKFWVKYDPIMRGHIFLARFMKITF